MKFKIKEIHALYCCVLVLAIALTWSFISHRPLMSEGSNWYYGVLHSGTVFRDVRLNRYFDYVIQGPSVMVIKIFGEIAFGAANKTAIWLLSFGWSMYVLFSLVVSALILKKHNREDLFAFQIIATLAAYMPASGYGVALAMPAMYCFWPMFYFLLFADGHRRSDFGWFLVMAVVLAICYEATIIFFGLFAFMALVDLYFLKNRNKYFNIFVISVSATASLILIIAVLNLPEENTGPFWSSLFSGLDNYRIFGACIAALTLPIPFFTKAGSDFRMALFILFGSAFAATVLYFGFLIYKTFLATEIILGPFPPFALTKSYYARATALPVTAGIAFICYLFKKSGSNRGWLAGQEGRSLLGALFIFTVMVSTIDVLLTNEWRAKFARFENYVSGIQGCVNLTAQQFQEHGWAPAIEYHSVSFSSILVQILREEPAITKLVFTQAPSPSQSNIERNACTEGSNGFYATNEGHHVNLRDGRIKMYVGSPSE